jgi:hypothetical protein
VSTPNVKIYCFEDQLEGAVKAWLLKNGLNEVNKQQDDPITIDGKKYTLKTPRVEVRFNFAGFSTEHYHINQSTKETWLDIGYGTLYLKIVTRRDGNVTHTMLRGTCRWLMQNRGSIGDYLEFHTLEKILEKDSSISFVADEMHDVSVLQFDVKMSIKPSKFPST